ncbi:MAG: hypothetical protein RSJ41_08150 [Clostridia bacterium]
MTDTKPNAVWDWLLTCPLIADLFFNFGASEDGATLLVPLTAYSDVFDVQFVDGGGFKHCDFSLIRFEALESEPNNTRNIDVLKGFTALCQWIDDAGEAGRFPAFPRGCLINRLYVLPSETGYLSAQDETQAKYMLQFRIEYLYEKE